MKKILAFFLILYVASLTSADFKRESPVKIKFIPAQSARAGSTIEAKFEVEIGKDWHIFSEKPEISGIVPSQLILDPSDDFSVEKITLSKPTPVRSDIFEKTVNFYQDKMTISVLLKLNSKAGVEIPVKGIFQFQACSSRLCLPPTKQEFSATQPVKE